MTSYISDEQNVQGRGFHAKKEAPHDQKTDTRPTVRLKPNSYQPSKAEPDELIVIHKRDGSIPSQAELAQTALRPMTIMEDDEA
ncbi:MAG: hypothetical protein OXC63_03950 [Aestuariivita sp.]|nr:hypothetical protein [Aestuariivita sp.]MCY4347015.1 hypothetical protein [Aestuariivita sp.]